MGKNITGRRQYESIRSLLSHIYLYGFFSREDFEAANIIKVKSYDQELRLIYDIFPKDEQNALVRGGHQVPADGTAVYRERKIRSVRAATRCTRWTSKRNCR